MFNFSQDNDFESILNRCLARIDNNLDKRQGSIIYDAIAPVCAELAQCYIALDVYSDQSYLLTATDINLDTKAHDYGITRNPATYSLVKIDVFDTDNQPLNVDIGTRFSLPNELGGYNYTIILKLADGEYEARCETAGDTVSNYTGELLPLVSINNLGKAVLETVIKPGEDEESDTNLRERVLAKINQETFAGNKSAYERFVNDIDGVEKCKIFPVWNGGGTVKVAIIASNNTLPTSEFVDDVQELIDPIQNQGEGLGIAPIGHTVTVVSPEQLNINIEATLTLLDDYTIEELQTDVEEQIATYIKEVQEKWEIKDTLIIYQSKIIAAILEVPKIENVSSLTINGQDADLVINLTGTNVKFPILNGVVLNESE